MKRLFSSVILSSLLLLCACGSAIEDNGRDDGGTLLVNLDISVSLSDIAGASTKAGEYEEAADDNEKMNSLRVVIVRPDWTVEANRLINLASAGTDYRIAEPFRVAGNEKKWIYLFVNESTMVYSGTGNTGRRLVEYDLGTIQVGSYFPASAIEGLKIRLEENTEQIKGPLPMSERHEYFVSREPEQSCSLFVTRAAVKFTFHIINRNNSSITLNKLKINRMAHIEWFMPRAEYSLDESGQHKITDYEVPADAGYYAYENVSGVTVPGNGETVLDPVYLLEGKYTDENSEGRNYSMYITLNNAERMHYFPDLRTLPRNTHVVVNITYDEKAETSCAVDVIPYSEIVLEPGFGL